MIIPARWYSGGKGLDDFRKETLADNRYRVLHDYVDASECFPNVEIKGGVCYFLWDRDNPGLCSVNTHYKDQHTTMERALKEPGADIFIRYNDAIKILEKVRKYKEDSIDTILSSRKPFGFPTNFKNFAKSESEGTLKIYANKAQGFVKKGLVEKNHQDIEKYKVIVPYAFGSGDSRSDRLKPITVGPGTVCTETYIYFGPFNSIKECQNLVSYINTKFFHFLLTLVKNTQHATSKVYKLIPLQDFSETWSDELLYKKYDLTKEEVSIIESVVGSEGF